MERDAPVFLVILMAPDSMLSGGAESSIMLWDLEQAEKSSKNFDHRPVAAAPKCAQPISSRPKQAEAE